MNTDTDLGVRKTNIRNEDVRATILPDGYVLLHSPKDNLVHTLTPLGGLVWEYCDGSNTIDDIVIRISEIDEIGSPPDLQSEVLALTDKLTESGLLIEAS